MLFTIESVDTSSKARAGKLELAHGTVSTPVFMPVATRGTIRAMPAFAIEDMQFEIILSNTYHLYIRPGTEVLLKAGGLHRYMNWNRPILTDSGGFQVFSLSDLCTVKKNGVEFRSHLDGSKHMFTPESVLDVQRVIGSDIMMVLDQCVEHPAEKKLVKEAVERTVEWAGISRQYYENFDKSAQALFAIVQGGTYEDVRKDCAQRLIDMDYPGYAIGGLSVGESKQEYHEMSELCASLLPVEKPRYMMGVGSPVEIVESVAHGVDMFDCVMPTRIARNGTLYTSHGRVNIRNAEHEFDFSPLDRNCDCYVCKSFSRSYLRHIFKMGEISALVYNTWHNLYFMKSMMLEIRESIGKNCFDAVRKKYNSLF
jgi:queuine tRNA-ribosyltransferase